MENKYIRVTSVFNIVRKEGLEHILGEMGNQYLDQKMREGAARGTKFHDDIVKFFQSKPHDVYPMLSEWKMWAFDSDLQTQLFEKRFNSDLYGITGRPDWIGHTNIKPGLWLNDWKTGKFLDTTVNWQLAAYVMLCRENGIEIDHRGVYDARKGEFYEITTDLKNDFACFQACMLLKNNYSEVSNEF